MKLRSKVAAVAAGIVLLGGMSTGIASAVEPRVAPTTGPATAHFKGIPSVSWVSGKNGWAPQAPVVATGETVAVQRGTTITLDVNGDGLCAGYTWYGGYWREEPWPITSHSGPVTLDAHARTFSVQTAWDEMAPPPSELGIGAPWIGRIDSYSTATLTLVTGSVVSDQVTVPVTNLPPQ